MYYINDLNNTQTLNYSNGHLFHRFNQFSEYYYFYKQIVLLLVFIYFCCNYSSFPLVGGAYVPDGYFTMFDFIAYSGDRNSNDSDIEMFALLNKSAVEPMVS